MQFSPQSHNMDRAFQPSTVLKSYLGLNVRLFLYSRNIRSISKKLTLLRPVTNSVAKMMTASGGHGYRTIRSAVSLPIALTQSRVQDIQMWVPAQTASVDSKRKQSLLSIHCFAIISFLHFCLLFQMSRKRVSQPKQMSGASCEHKSNGPSRRLCQLLQRHSGL